MLGRLVEVDSLTPAVCCCFFPCFEDCVCFYLVGVGWRWLGDVMELLHDHWLLLLLPLLPLAVNFLN